MFKIEEFIKEIINNIQNELLFIIPALIILGIIIKSTLIIPNRFIPLILLFVGEILSILFLGFSVTSIVQGILISGASVFSYEIYKQIITQKE